MPHGTCKMQLHLPVYMRIQRGRHTWIVMCRFNDNDCLIIYTVHVGLCICLNYFNQSYKVSLTDQDRSLYIYILKSIILLSTST